MRISAVLIKRIWDRSRISRIQRLFKGGLWLATLISITLGTTSCSLFSSKEKAVTIVPKQSLAQAQINPAQVPPPVATITPTTTAAPPDWRLLLVNQRNPLPPNWTVKLVTLSNQESVDERIYPALQKMFDAARAAGVYPIVRSGYRTAADQLRIKEETIKEFIAKGMSEDEAKAETAKWVAEPGTSEHQLGLAVDINADGVNSTGEQVYAWLSENAEKYGFINRYPADKVAITGISNEPWHYRYVGVEAAQQMKRTGLCLEEYLGK